MSKKLSILERLVVAKNVITKSNNIIQTTTAKEEFKLCVNLLCKGYSVDEYVEPLLKQYKTLDKIPDSRAHAGKVVTNDMMVDYFDGIMANLPHGHGMGLIIMKYNSDSPASYIHNVDKPDFVRALRETADAIESGKDFPMISPN